MLCAINVWLPMLPMYVASTSANKITRKKIQLFAVQFLAKWLVKNVSSEKLNVGYLLSYVSVLKS